MPEIEDIDKNFRAIDMDGVPLALHRVDTPPFALDGLPWYEQEKRYCRLPQAVIPETNEGVRELCWHTAGALVRFRSDSTAVGLHAELRHGGDLSHMPRSGSGGFDLYEGEGAAKVFRANLRHEHGSTTVRGLFRRDLPRQMREWTIYLPLYNGLENLQIALDPHARLAPPAPFKYRKPILFYGSSITQGGCASRPGNAYPAIITRRLDANLVNWGFSGSCRGETVMAQTIASLDLAAFVFDYDHNAPTPEHLQQTHEPFFQTIRQTRPELPVVFVSMPDFDNSQACIKRRNIIRHTYETARADGDRKVFFVDGETLFGNAERDLCTVDGCHPNDIGFLRMADHILPAVQLALNA